jgi:hypothetical protein
MDHLAAADYSINSAKLKKGFFDRAVGQPGHGELELEISVMA